MKFDNLIFETSDRVATITINRPEKRNTLTEELLTELCTALNHCDTNDDIGAIILTGSGDRAFCAGADLGGSIAAGHGVYGRHEAGRKFLNLFQTIADIGKPVICAVNGHCLGGGLGLALSCDIVVAVEEAKLGTPEIKLGLFPHVIMATIFRNVSHPKRAWEMIITGSRLGAEEARDIGMVNHVVKPDELMSKSRELATQLAAWSPVAMRLGRRSFHTMRDMSFSQAMDYLHAVLTVNTMTEDTMEGISAFFGKREPEWKGR